MILKISFPNLVKSVIIINNFYFLFEKVKKSIRLLMGKIPNLDDALKELLENYKKKGKS